ncbi:NADH-quinone oxidoreductase subunit NuoF [Desulfotomaculum varum]
MKIKNLQDLERIKHLRLPDLSARLGATSPQGYQVMCCTGTGCSSGGSEPVIAALREQIARQGLQEKVRVFKTGCFGFCKMGPILVVHPGQIFYCLVQAEDAAELVEQHFKQGRLVERLLYREPGRSKSYLRLPEIPFFQAQKRIALRNCGLINPEDIEDYIANDGYFALYDVLHHKTPGEVIEIISRSGLRGRGGGGFPTGKKWQFTAQAAGSPKYVVCNADEGDPGAFMDRSILEGDPHSVLEAMAIAGYSIGANQGIIYVRAEYPIAIKRLELAIAQARQAGLLGYHILNSNFSFDIELRLGAGAFVCGEETALLKSAMGQRGEPRPRPPFPAVCGFRDKPTLLNNVETYANVPVILRQGWQWYASLGTENSKGTKVFSIAGKINNTGLIEVPMGTTLRTVIYDIGGGIPGGRQFKAVQTGGPSGGVIPASLLDTPIDYESLSRVGSMMGSGGLIVMDETDCMVDIAKFYLEFSQDESCGKCTPCRVGTRRMLEIMERITQGKGEPADLDELEELAHDIKDASLCGLGQTAPNPVLSTLRFFRDEYIAHVRDKTCPAGVCRELTDFVIDAAKCISCGLCARACGVQAISGEKKQPFYIDRQKCIKCGACQARCPKEAIFKAAIGGDITNANRPGDNRTAYPTA